MAAYGLAEIIEQDHAALHRLIIEKYTSEDQSAAMMQRMVNDPSRVIIVLHPDKIVNL